MREQPEVLSEVQSSTKLNRRERRFLQAEIDGLLPKEFAERYGIGPNGRQFIRQNLEEKFAGEVAARGLWLATVEAVRLGFVETTRLEPHPRGPINEIETAIMEAVYHAESNFDIAQLANIDIKAVHGVIDGVVKKLGFKNIVQLLAWMASEDKKVGKL